MAYRMASVLVTLNDLEGHSLRSFPVCRPFQVQSIEHLCSILPDFNWQHARAVPQQQLGFLLEWPPTVWKFPNLAVISYWAVYFYGQQIGLLSIFGLGFL